MRSTSRPRDGSGMREDVPRPISCVDGLSSRMRPMPSCLLRTMTPSVRVSLWRGAGLAVIPFGGERASWGAGPGARPASRRAQPGSAPALRPAPPRHAQRRGDPCGGDDRTRCRSAALRTRLELGHFPQSFRYATIGGFAAARSSGQNSAGNGRFEAMVTGIRVATPTGDLDLGRAPGSAAGPDLLRLFLGSEGIFGVITEVRVRVHPVPTVRIFESWTFPDFAGGADALRRVVQQGRVPRSSVSPTRPRPP